MEIGLIEFLLLLSFVRANYEICRGSDGESICCSGLVWNSSLMKCQPCMVGFNGPNCSMKCFYPAYGLDCQETCHCSEELCSYANGCMKWNDDITTGIGSHRIPSYKTTREVNNSTFMKGLLAGNINTGQYNCKKGMFLPKKTPGIYQIVICLTTISVVFLLLYLVTHIFIIKFQPDRTSSPA